MAPAAAAAGGGGGDEKANKNRGSTDAESRNWEQRVLNEIESPNRWRETWGELFQSQSEVPFDGDARIAYFEKKLKEQEAKYKHAMVRLPKVQKCSIPF